MISFSKPAKNQRGYTLPELLVVMTIFLIIIMVTASGFKTVISQVGQQSKTMETEIGSIVGLEMLRADVQNAGYGLPWSFLSSGTTPAGVTPSYTEVTSGDSGGAIGASFWPGGSGPTTFNDAPSNPPRAVQSGNTTFNTDGTVGSKYLVIKSLTAVPGATQKKWVTISYGINGYANPITRYNAPDRDLQNSDWVIVLRNSFVDNVPNRQLQTNTSGSFATTFSNYSTLITPHSSGDIFQVYGVNAADASMTNLRMPFNRADYYVRRPSSMPPACAPNTGILFKAYASQKGGFTEVPLLDCVADMQVVFGVAGIDGTINDYPSSPGSNAADIRNNVKEIRLYILAHEGKKDQSFNYPSSTVTVGETLLGSQRGRVFNLNNLIGGDWNHYRWKVYTIVARPKNLIQ